MTQVEEFEDKERRDERYRELRARGTPNVSRHSDPVLIENEYKDRWYVTRGC